jgi:hypothetical protein
MHGEIAASLLHYWFVNYPFNDTFECDTFDSAPFESNVCRGETCFAPAFWSGQVPLDEILDAEL